MSDRMVRYGIEYPIHTFGLREAEAYIASRQVGDEFPVLFTCRSRRNARVVRINRNGRPVIQTWITGKGVWSPERPMTLNDVLTDTQQREARKAA